MTVRLSRTARAHTLLAGAAGGTAGALYAAVADAIRQPGGPAAEGFFFLASRERILPVGVDRHGHSVLRSTPSALDLGAWASGRSDGFAPFGYVRGPWITLELRAGGVRVGGAVMTEVTAAVDASLRLEVESLAAHAAALLRMRSALEEAERLAMTDTLTAVASRRHFLDRLGRACAARDPYMLFFCDLDDFKQVNDRAGHEAGDRVLIAAAQALVHAGRSDDLVARFGGDEFAVLVRAQGEDGPAIAERFEGALAEVGVSVSIGFAIVERDPSTVLRDADAAMYAVKALRKTRARLRVVPARAPTAPT